MKDEELQTRFTYHSPTGDQPTTYVRIREAAKHYAELLCLLTPESREQSLALTKLEETVFWANAAVARRS